MINSKDNEKWDITDGADFIGSNLAETPAGDGAQIRLYCCFLVMNSLPGLLKSLYTILQCGMLSGSDLLSRGSISCLPEWTLAWKPEGDRVR